MSLIYYDDMYVMYLNVLLLTGKLFIITEVIAFISVVDTGILSLEKHSVGIRFYIDVLNENRRNSCTIHQWSKKCCLTDSSKEDCDIFGAYGGCTEVVRPRDRKTLLFVSPMLQQHDLVGYCDFVLDCLCNVTRDQLEVPIPFDTRINKKASKALVKHYIHAIKVTACENLDEDSLNYCEPVDCGKKYFDKRPVFDRNSNKCIEVPACETDLAKELPDVVYLPNSNTCRDLDVPLSVQDIFAISTGLGIVTASPTPADDIIVQLKSNCSTISQNLNLLRDLMYGNLCPLAKGVVLDYRYCCNSAMQSIVICVVSICCILLIFTYCLKILDWIYDQWIGGNIKKCWRNCKGCFKKKNGTVKTKREKVNKKVKNALLREVIMKDIPLELRHSVIDVCERAGKGVAMKRRYRKEDIGSQISLGEETDSLIPSTTSSDSENE